MNVGDRVIDVTEYSTKGKTGTVVVPWPSHSEHIRVKYDNPIGSLYGAYRPDQLYTLIEVNL